MANYKGKFTDIGQSSTYPGSKEEKQLKDAYLPGWKERRKQGGIQWPIFCLYYK